MPSPIAHGAVGLAVFLVLRRQNLGQIDAKTRFPGLGLGAIALAFSLLPDVDSILGLLAGDIGRYHNGVTHSLLVGLALSLVAGSAARTFWRTSFWQVFLLAVFCYGFHVTMDWATVSRGVMAFWPLTSERYLAPVALFYGLHWSDGWLSLRHLWTVLTELLFAALLVFLTITLPCSSRLPRS
jgi:membrane-bound metal-dependent hydrolase YbcI (DUF457 family)